MERDGCGGFGKSPTKYISLELAGFQWKASVYIPYWTDRIGKILNIGTIAGYGMFARRPLASSTVY
jgi:hypothetical protein